MSCRRSGCRDGGTKGSPVRQKGTFRILVSAAAVCMFLPAMARADFTPLSSPDQISGTVFTFDNVGVGFVNAATNVATQLAGFTFADAGDPLSGEYIAANSEGGHVLDVLGGTLGFDGLVRFRFEELVLAAGVDYDTATPLSILAYDDSGNLLNPEGSVTAPAGTVGFFGIASDIGIRTLLIHDSAGTFQLDNLKYGTAVVPAPGAWALGALGLALVGLVRRRS